MSEEVKIDAKRVQAITNMGQAYDDVDPLVEAARNHAIKRVPAVTISWSTPKTSTIIRS
ncbi:Acetyltransferase [Limosilactobacillus fermentum F-6]|nr:Acetyltransferase [Limosilactobacillus fermentum F-6]